MSSGFFSSVAGFGKGFVAGAKAGGEALVGGVTSLVKGGYALATDPQAQKAAWETGTQLANGAADYAGKVYDDPAKAYRDTKNGVAAMYTKFDEARDAAAARGESAEFWGQVAGRGAFEVGVMVIPAVGVASKAGKAGKVSTAVGAAGKLGKAGKAVDAVDDVADLAKAGAKARAAKIGDALPDAPICTQGCPNAKPAAAKSIVAKTVRDQNWFDDIARKSTRNPDSDTLVLGHYSSNGPSYNKMAADNGSTYFQVDNWDELTDGMSQDEIWRINETFLEQQILQGKKIKFSHAPGQANAGTFFEKEVEFLKDIGYRFEQRNGVWEAVL